MNMNSNATSIARWYRISLFAPCARSFARHLSLFLKLPNARYSLSAQTSHTPRPTSQDLPDGVFEIMQPDCQRFADAAQHGPPSVQEFKWTGEKANANFKVCVRPGAMLGSMLCGAHIIEGSTVTRLSFRVEVVDPGGVRAGAGGTETRKLHTNMEQVRMDVAKIDHRELEFNNILGKGVQVRIRELKGEKAGSICARAHAEEYS